MARITAPTGSKYKVFYVILYGLKAICCEHRRAVAEITALVSQLYMHRSPSCADESPSDRLRLKVYNLVFLNLLLEKKQNLMAVPKSGTQKIG